MSKIARMDPELAAPLAAFPPLVLTSETLPLIRAGSKEMAAALHETLPKFPDVLTEDRAVPGPEGAPDVPVRVYRPGEAGSPLPALLWIHGGGYVLGDVEGDDLNVKQMTRAVGCVIVSVEYRLAPETPFPGPLEDCYAALKWLHGHAEELGLDPARLASGGASAGGGLAAGLGLLARDRGEVPLCFQLLIYPMIDDRNILGAEQAGSDTHIWSRASNRFGWTSYLGREPGGEVMPYYAAPARAEDLAGLPPTFINVGDLDLFLDEDIEYAQRLLRVGVPTELHVYPGAYHGFNGLAPTAGVSRRANEDIARALRHALHGHTTSDAQPTAD